MDKKAIGERLRLLASDDTNKSKATRLRNVIDDVEVALSAGVSRSAVLDVLAANGLEMSLATFETTLKRIRKQRETRATNPLKSEVQTTGQSTKTVKITPDDMTEDQREQAVVSSHNPMDLDKIISSNPDLAALEKFAKRKPI